MIDQIKTTVTTSRDTLAGDLAGVAALAILLFAALHLPGAF